MLLFEKIKAATWSSALLFMKRMVIAAIQRLMMRLGERVSLSVAQRASPNEKMHINQEGLNLIKAHEGLRLFAYQDEAKVWTIGYGCTTDVHSGLVITQDEAEERLLKDVSNFEVCVKGCVIKPLNENEFSALVSLAYNIGSHGFHQSKLVIFLNQGKKEDASDEFLKFDHIDGDVSRGLLSRREAERALFLKPIPV